MNNTIDLKALTSAVAAIRDLLICDLDKRQPLLVALLVSIVDEVTDKGTLTREAPNQGLERMPYWLRLQNLTTHAGFRKLGNGHFGAAYAHDLLPGKVIKVGFKKEDSGAAYVAYCRMHQGTLGIPVIHDVQRHESCYTVVLDELHKCNYHNAQDQACLRAAREIIEGAYGNLKVITEELREDHPTIPSAFLETCMGIRQFFNGIASFDMHSGNIMFTKSGQPVITDPVSFTADNRELPVDPDALIGEVEKVMMERMIARCKARKAFRSTAVREKRKVDAKLRKVRRKAAERRAAQMTAGLPKGPALRPPGWWHASAGWREQ